MTKTSPTAAIKAAGFTRSKDATGETVWASEDGFRVSRANGSYGSGLRWLVQDYNNLNRIEAYFTARYPLHGIVRDQMVSNLNDAAEFVTRIRNA